MTRILNVDDCPVDRLLVRRTLGEEFGSIEVAWSGETALEKLDGGRFDLVITDMRMPGMDGLELMREVHLRYPDVPVILITGDGSETLAIKALRFGAANYVRKDVVATELPDVCRTVLNYSGDRESPPKLHMADAGRLDFLMPSRRSAVSDTVRRVRQFAAAATGADGATATRLGVAVEEAVLNALVHGNLEVSSELKNRDEDEYEALLSEREKQSPYRDRTVRVWMEWGPAVLIFGVLDEGPGFDPSQLPDPMAVEQLHRNSGRGILLMRSFMDTVKHSHGGRQVLMGVRIDWEPADRRKPVVSGRDHGGRTHANVDVGETVSPEYLAAV